MSRPKSPTVKVRVWTHPDLAQPIILHPSQPQPDDELGPAMMADLFDYQDVEMKPSEIAEQGIVLVARDGFNEETPIVPVGGSHSHVPTVIDTTIARPSMSAVAKRKKVSKAKWRLVAEDLLANEIDYGSFFPTAQLEKTLGLTREMPEFAFAMCGIRGILLNRGFYLTARGQHGEQYVVIPACENADVMLNMSQQASNALRKGIILGTMTSMDKLTPEERRRHESVLEKLAHKSALLRHSEKAYKLALPQAPELANA